MLVADALDDGHVAVLVEPLEAGHPCREAEMVVDLAQALRRQSKPRPCPVIGIVAEWNDGVQPIVGTGQFDHDEDAFIGRWLGCLRRGG